MDQAKLPYDLATLRVRAARFFAALLWLHLPVVVAVAYSNHVPLLPVCALLAAAAATATIAAWRCGATLAARLTIAASLTMAPMLMVYAGTGPWQIDWHMYFFVVFGMLVAFVDWRPIAVSASLTAAHHLVLDLVFPNAVFPEPGLERVTLHAGMVVTECLVLFWVIAEMKRLFRASRASLSAATEASRQLEYAAFHDPLTGLANRTVLSDRLLQSAQAALRNGQQMAVLFLDLDHFKVMNDTLGHMAGDDLLKVVALRIRGSLRAEDTLARLGGDEFVVVADVPRRQDAAALVDSVMESFRKPFAINGRLLHVTTSMGISVYPADGTTIESLLGNADMAMYRAKDQGRNTFQFFTRDMHAAAVIRLSTEIDLRHGLANGEFELYYQPVIDLRSGAAVSAEALIRWHHPTRGLVPPNEFIGIAEETGLIVPMGAWVLHEGARQARRLADLGFDRCYISLNVSGRQLRDPAFLDHVRMALNASCPKANSLGLEITESAALGDPDRALALLDECKRLGLLILLDDFGTHYSSLMYLKKFPIDVIKIDKSFIDGLPDDTDDTGIVKSILTLGQGLHCQVLAEGVESAEQAR